MNVLPDINGCDETAAKALVWDKPVRPWVPRVVEPPKRRQPRRASLWGWLVGIHKAVADWLDELLAFLDGLISFREMLLTRQPKWWAWPLMGLPWLLVRVKKEAWKDIRGLLGLCAGWFVGYALLVLFLGVWPR